MSGVTDRKRQHIDEIVQEQRELVDMANRQAGRPVYTVSEPDVPGGLTPWMLDEIIASIQRTNADLRRFLRLPQKN